MEEVANFTRSDFNKRINGLRGRTFSEAPTNPLHKAMLLFDAEMRDPDSFVNKIGGWKKIHTVRVFVENGAVELNYLINLPKESPPEPRHHSRYIDYLKSPEGKEEAYTLMEKMLSDPSRNW